MVPRWCSATVHGNSTDPGACGSRHIHDEGRADGAVPATRLLSANDVVEQPGLSYRAVLRAIRCGELKASKRPGRMLIRPEWFDEWIDGGLVEARQRAVLAEVKDSCGQPRRVRCGRWCEGGRGSVRRQRTFDAKRRRGVRPRVRMRKQLDGVVELERGRITLAELMEEY
jgi:hypothetical protein